MKKQIIAAVLLSVSMHGQAETVDKSETAELEILKGPAIGALAGALLAGPPGVMVGIMGGALIGHIKQQEDQIDRVNGELAVAQEQVNSLDKQQANQYARIQHQISINRTRLGAIANGFSFCIRFRTDGADIEPAIQPHLDALVGMLKAFPELGIEVMASADRRGSEAYNMELTRLRAEQVTQRLVDAGISLERIRTRIEGKGLARYPENDTEGLGFDRYVVLSFLSGAAI
ncbi:MAG: OmpA family protein [Pseudomonadota bacterium]